MIKPLVEHIIETQEQIDEVNWAKMAGGIALAGILATGSPAMVPKAEAALSHREYSQQDYINAIVGEAENQGYEGMLAIASAIRNRAKQPYYRNNVLHGVFGKNSARIDKASPAIFQTARKAWKDSATVDSVNGGYIWGNASDIELFKKQSWFKNVKLAKQVKDHYFYKNK